MLRTWEGKKECGVVICFCNDAPSSKPPWPISQKHNPDYESKGPGPCNLAVVMIIVILVVISVGPVKHL